jgi:excisionase family DNA binding protein
LERWQGTSGDGVAGKRFLTIKQIVERLQVRPDFVRRGTVVFSVKQAAEQLGVSAKLVYSLCAGGKIVHERHGLGRGTIRIAEEALEKYRRSARAFYRRLAEMR